MTYWVTLKKPIRHHGADRQHFSVDGETEAEARSVIVKHFGDGPGAEIADVKPLPYPAEPRLGYTRGDCPSFCMHPTKCAGRHSCPRNIACSE